MAVRIQEGAIQILMKEYKLSKNDIIVKQTTDGILFYLGENPTKISLNYKEEISPQQTKRNNIANSGENAVIDSVAVIETGKRPALNLYGKFPPQFDVLPTDSGFMVSYPDKIVLGKKLESKRNLSKGSIFSSFAYNDSSLVFSIKKDGVAPLFVSSIPFGVVVYFKDRQQLTANLIVLNNIQEDVSPQLVFVTDGKSKEQQNDDRFVLYVLGKNVNLRQSPSASAKIAGKAAFGEKLIATKKEGKWYAVTSGKSALSWIFEDLVGDSLQFSEANNLSRKEEQSKEEQNIVQIQVENKNNATNAKGNNDTQAAANTEADISVIKPAEKSVINVEDDNAHIVSIDDIKARNRPQKDDTPITNTPLDTNMNTDTDTLDVVTAEKNLYIYTKRGRDPFLPLDKSNFIREGLPNINNITLVGILYDTDDAIALFEERSGNSISSFSMKIGDPVVSGKLLRIDASKVIFLMRESTFSYTVEKELNVN
jgi:uncharacterized protein YgiM (DUF1202 family)